MTLDFLGGLERTAMCDDLRVEDAGKRVVLMGRVNRRQDHGNLIFSGRALPQRNYAAITR